MRLVWTLSHQNVQQTPFPCTMLQHKGLIYDLVEFRELLLLYFVRLFVLFCCVLGLFGFGVFLKLFLFVCLFVFMLLFLFCYYFF